MKPELYYKKEGRKKEGSKKEKSFYKNHKDNESLRKR
jgi:hypothetical protein